MLKIIARISKRFYFAVGLCIIVLFTTSIISVGHFTASPAWAAGGKGAPTPKPAKKPHKNLRDLKKALADLTERCSKETDEEKKKKCLIDGKKQLVGSYSNWHFGSTDPKNPNHDKIIEEILDALMQYMETCPIMVDVNLTINITNQPGPGGAPADTYMGGPGGGTQTHYNNQQQSGWFNSGRGPVLAQLPNSGQFEADFFVRLTVRHEFGHVKFVRATQKNAHLPSSWIAHWSNALSFPQQLPDQYYYDVDLASFQLAFAHSAPVGFATAISYYETALTFAEPTIWNFVATFDDLYLQ